MQENSNTAKAVADSSPDAATPKQSASAAKAQAARENGKKSHGPKTAAGKARSSQNAYKHGFYANRLFATREQWEKDGAEYQAIARGLVEHYKPVGYMENLLVERIATGFLRSARIVGHEQKVFGWTVPFEARSASSLPRYQSTIERQIAKDTEHLERLQAERKAETASIADGERDEQLAAVETSDTQQPQAAAGIDEQSVVGIVLPPEHPGTGPKPAATNGETNPRAVGGQITETNPPKPRSVLAEVIDKIAS